MSEGRKERGRKGGQPEAKAGGSSPMGWIMSANLLALVAVVLAVVALVLQFTEEDEGGTPTVANPSPTAQPTPTPVVVDVSVDDDPSIGPEDAAVTIVEFSDYT